MSGTPGVDQVVTGVASRLRFPYLLVFTGVLFVLDLLIPDMIPFLDEILLGLGTLIFATWRTRTDRGGAKPAAPPGDGPVVDVPPDRDR